MELLVHRRICLPVPASVHAHDVKYVNVTLRVPNFQFVVPHLEE